MIGWGGGGVWGIAMSIPTDPRKKAEFNARKYTTKQKRLSDIHWHYFKVEGDWGGR